MGVAVVVVAVVVVAFVVNQLLRPPTLLHGPGRHGWLWRAWHRPVRH